MVINVLFCQFVGRLNSPKVAKYSVMRLLARCARIALVMEVGFVNLAVPSFRQIGQVPRYASARSLRSHRTGHGGGFCHFGGSVISANRPSTPVCVCSLAALASHWSWGCFFAILWLHGCRRRWP